MYSSQIIYKIIITDVNREVLAVRDVLQDQRIEDCIRQTLLTVANWKRCQIDVGTWENCADPLDYGWRYYRRYKGVTPVSPMFLVFIESTVPSDQMVVGT